jgi:hypothetical protein
MITRPERKRRHVVEIAIALSIAIHMLFGLLVPWAHGLQAIPAPHGTPPPTVALSDVVTIEKRTVPRPHPLAQKQPVQPQRATAPVKPQVQQPPAPPVPQVVKKEEVAPHPQRHELVADKGKEPAPPKKPDAKLEVAYAQPHQQPPSKQRLPYSQQQIAALSREFSQTIAQEREHANPMDVQTAPPAGLKEFKLQIQGIHSQLRSGEGIITPSRAWNQDGYHYYYINYELVYMDGQYESGAVPWPVRFRPREDVLLMRSRFQMPCPVPDYPLPDTAGFMQLQPALREGLRLCFPGRYPDDPSSGG